MSVIFKGKVGSGFGGARGDVAKGSYKSLSTNLYNGTLNVYSEDSPWMLPLPPKMLIDHDGARCLIWDAVIKFPSGETLEVWAMFPQHRKIFTWNVIEILSPVPLRKTYDLENGTEVEVNICPTIPMV